MKKYLLVLSVIFFCGNAKSQSYDFSSITQMLNDSSSLYLNRIYVEVYKNDTSIYQYQTGFLQCNNVRLGQGSATKWISAAIMLRLTEQGWWNLDDSIGSYLPIFSQYGKGHITLRQSYSMSSGMFNSGTQPQKYHTNSSLTLAQSVDSIAINVPIEYATGSMIGYDGTMMHAWGRVAEVVDSIHGNFRDWRTIAKEEFFDLMTMDSTDYTDFYPNNPAVAGGIETTPCDYLKFLKMLANNGIYNGDSILMQSSIDEMFADQTNSAPIYNSYWPSNHPDFPNGLDTMRYTFGAWWLEKDINNNIIGIASPGVFGHYPFYDRCRNIYGTFFCYVPIQFGSGLKMLNTYLHFMKLLRDETGPCSLTTSINEIKSYNNFIVFPNPASTCISFSGEQIEEPFNAYILNVNGTLLLKSNNQKNIDISHLETGFYF